PLQVEYAALWEEVPDGDELLLKAVEGWQRDPALTVSVPKGDPLVRRALRSSAVALARREEGETITGGGDEDETSTGIGVAIRGASESFGVLAAYSREERAFTATD